jgi:hypothetical protein
VAVTESDVVTGARIPGLLDALAALSDGSERELVEELLRDVTELYGAGLARVVEIAGELVPPGDGLGELALRLSRDELVSSLLTLHGLHPMPLRTRVESALDGVRPALAGGDVRILELDEESGRLKLRLLPASPFPAAIERRVRRVIDDAVPEISELVIDGPAPAPLVVGPNGEVRSLEAGAGASAGAISQPVSIQVRRRRAPAQAEVEESCDLCATPVSEEHDHLVNIEDRTIMCACRACWLLFSDAGAGGKSFRAVPDRYVELMGLAEVSSSEWDSLDIPVAVAFFFHNSILGRVAACYPGPAGATETLLPLDAFEGLVARDRLLRTLAPDVEAVIIRRGKDEPLAFIVPITACYELVGELRRCWKGFDGGVEARSALSSFFDRVRARAAPDVPRS